VCVCVYIYMAYGALQSKKLLWHEISYPDDSNGQSEFLNNFFMSKSCELSNYFLNFFKKQPEIGHFLKLFF
jgi:hypothetical protein